MLSPLEILNKYWGYDSFRTAQLDVIHAILEGKDTLVLLPTGGGKSICYQVPSLMTEGICIVISPLIALMNDQVSQLKARQIRATAITSAMSYAEVDIALDNCIYGNYKFLYLSPERLENDMVKTRLQKMNINLIAVDESHCISEWGYNFRPSYLKIAQIRKLTNATVVALTATATEQVVDDIQEKLEFKNKHIIKTSFYRNELAYVVLKHEDKDMKIIQILKKVKGSAIIYCKTRKETKRIHTLLKEYGISSQFYHGGLDIAERESKQKKWVLNHVRVMVATNAFGMGIDKSDVRVVIHNHIPLSLEAYFQEAGRAGRDKKLAYAILVCNSFDVDELKKDVENHYPSLENLKIIYQHLANYLGIANGSGQFSEFPFHLNDFCEKYSLNYLKTFNVLKLLEKEEFIKLSEAVNQPSRIFIKVSHTELYQFQIANKPYDVLLKILLRSYGTLFDNYTKIQESIIAKRSQLSIPDVKILLEKLNAFNIIEYIPQNSDPKILFLKPKMNVNSHNFSSSKIERRKNIDIEKANKATEYISNTIVCRSSFLQNYFAEKNQQRCGKCDVCLERNKLNINQQEFDKIMKDIKNLLQNTSMSVNDIVMSLIDYREDKIVEVLQYLSDNKIISMNTKNQVIWIS
ncbi:MAG: RecQ family ATP-dependent DNA helicase [Flavobacteriales bacterium]